MDTSEDFRNQADGHAGTDEPETAAVPAASHASSAPHKERLPLIRFCAWCKEICIRPKTMRAEDALLIYIHGGERKAFWNGRELVVGDGICESYRAREYPESLKGKKP